MMDKIFIKDLLLRCIIGVNEWERRDKQDVLINIILFTDIQSAGRNDRFEETVDYRALTKEIIDEVEKSSFQLVEALAEKIAEICLKRSRVRKVKVSVEKPGALRFARSVGVEIERTRSDE